MVDEPSQSVDEPDHFVVHSQLRDLRAARAVKPRRGGGGGD